MESQALGEPVEWEARRVAAAFDIEEFERGPVREMMVYELCGNVGVVTPRRVVDFVGTTFITAGGARAAEGARVHWCVEEEGNARSIEVGPEGEGSKVFWNNDVGDKAFRWRTWPCPSVVNGHGGVVPNWRVRANAPYDGPLACGLWRLGLGDENVLAQLPPLSGGRKIELRLSMPREFWLESWKEEHVANTDIIDFEYEMRRHATAFEIATWSLLGYERDQWVFRVCGQRADGWWVDCTLSDENDWWMCVSNDHPNEAKDFFSVLCLSWGEYGTNSYPSLESEATRKAVSILASGAFRLGRSLNALEVEWNTLFTAHEWLEMRLSMPRELWPKNWLDEDSA